ncbi:eukaryotic translation initiation factor 5 [Coemansia sp. RSA 2711]|nr:eukaryotic translation initiation factor 5 [Coemansia sp. RSA 2711]KAJ2366268.1 eukaryotic translation initiation factor 5 [Coemansia sp. RSA 2610]
MATNINIRRDIKDPFYRYKMPRLQAKVEGKGNGIKTVLPNIVDVAKALSRPPAYPTKYFSSELGAQMQVDEVNERFIVNGAHEAERLQQLLDGFIDRYVLCASCKSPETDLKVSGDQTITRICMACGQISSVNMGHRLSTYIIKNPPPKVKKGGKHASAQKDGSAQASDDDLDALVAETAALEVSGDDDDWGYDEDVLGDDMAPAGAFAADSVDPFDQLGDFIAEHKDDDDAIFAKASELDLSTKHRALVVVVQCLFDGSATPVKDIARHKRLLGRFGTSDKHQRAIIGGFERLIEANMDTLLAKTPTLLMSLFDKDIVEEDVLLEWGKRPSKKYVDKDAAKRIHKAAQPFLEWLATAESESESE